MLPRIDIPTYDIVIPSTKEKMKFRPFLIKEEKILLMANSGDDIEEKIEAVKQIIRNCIVQEVDVEKLATFDIEYIFIQLRSKSVSNILKLTYDHDECTEGDPIELPFELNLETVEVEYIEGDSHTNRIELTDSIGMMMRYPNFSTMDKLLKTENFQDIVEIISTCIEIIFDGDDIFNPSDHTSEEVMDFIESLTQEQFEKINEFFETMPQAVGATTIKCPKCGFEKEMRVSGITDFFT